MDRPSFVAIGKIVRAHGIKGYLAVDDRLTDNPDRFPSLKSVYIETDDGNLLYEIEDCSRANRGWLLKLKGVDHREEAQKLAGNYIVVEVNSLPALEGDNFYDFDLVGMEVTNADSGEILGRLEEVVHYPANAVYIIRGPNGVLTLPATHEVVKKVDIANQRMEVMLLDGIEFE